MDSESPQFIGPPCGQCSTHTFFREFRYSKDGKTKSLKIGEFFFVKISALHDPCIGELQLLCENKNISDQQLSTVRLYFLPEQTHDGRLPHHGEDEVLVASDRLVLRLEDLVGWITEEVEWNHGIIAPCIPRTNSTDIVKEELKEEDEEEAQEVKLESDDNNNDQKSTDRNKKLVAKDELIVDDEVKVKEEIDDEEVKVNGEADEEDLKEDIELTDETKVVVLSYSSYCRYRSILRRLQGGIEDSLSQNAMVIAAIGGFEPRSRKTHVLFCRSDFEHDEVAHHELNCEYLAPTIKGKRRKRKSKTARSTSPESNTSEDVKEIIYEDNQTIAGVKQPPVKSEQEFLQRLFKFMKIKKTPIHRVPHLGFKQIDLYVFYSFAQKLGGYDKITTKRLWKHVYDELGGNPGSTSAATCTRRHYERLLLPFERYMDGIIYKPERRKSKGLKKKQSDQTNEKSDSPTTVSSESQKASSTLNMDAYEFTDSNSKDSDSNELCIVENEEPECEENGEKEEEKEVWSIQKPEEKEVWSIQKPENEKGEETDDGKTVKPLIVQKNQNETFAEKERKWDEIRKKNAAARKWVGNMKVRQSRSGKNGKLFDDSPKLEVHTNSNDAQTTPSKKIKTEFSIGKDNLDIKLPSLDMPKLLPPSFAPGFKIKTEHQTSGFKISSDDKKPSSSELGNHRPKSWCGYSVFPESNSLVPLRGQSPRTGTQSEPGDLHSHSGRHSVGSMSVSSAVSTEISDGKPIGPQRRPSVIQHTHTDPIPSSPSPSPSPKQKDIVQQKEAVPFTSPKASNLPNQMSYSTSGKVAEWLTKGAGMPNDVIACRTPMPTKPMDIHDKVMMPSSCKTPGLVGAGKVPSPHHGKGKQSHQKSPKVKQPSPVKHKYSTPHQQQHYYPDPKANHIGNGVQRNDVRNNNHSYHQKMAYQSAALQSSASSMKHSTSPKSMNAAYPAKLVNASYPAKSANTSYPNGPYYGHPKRYKIQPSVPAQPTPSLFSKQQMYCTPPLSDIPKTATTTHNDYELSVLDLSLKKKPAHSASAPKVVEPPPTFTADGCLDLTVKRPPASDNGIENITPPPPMPSSPNVHHTMSSPSQPYMYSSIPNLTPIHNNAVEEPPRRGYASTRIPQMSNASMNMAMTLATSGKMPSLSPMAAYSKEMAKSLYAQSAVNSHHFPQYVIPPFYQPGWAVPPVQGTKQPTNSQTSHATLYKGVANGVYPKNEYPYNVMNSGKASSSHYRHEGHYPMNRSK